MYLAVCPVYAPAPARANFGMTAHGNTGVRLAFVCDVSAMAFVALARATLGAGHETARQKVLHRIKDMPSHAHAPFQAVLPPSPWWP